MMNASRPNVILIIAVACLPGPAFGVSFTLALDRSRPHDVPGSSACAEIIRTM